MDAALEIEREVSRLNEKLRHVYASENKIDRVYTDIHSLEKKYNENELRIAETESDALAAIAQKDVAVKIKTRIDALSTTKMLLGPIKSSIEWLSSEYPEVSAMTIVEVFDFIDGKKVELSHLHDKTRKQIQGFTRVENKYQTLIKRRKTLEEKIEQKTTEYIKLMDHADQLSKEIDSIGALQKIKASMKSIVKDQLAIECIKLSLGEM